MTRIVLLLAVEARVSLLLYVIGFVVIVSGLASLATVAGITQIYVLVGVAVLIGIGLVTVVTRTAARDPA